MWVFCVGMRRSGSTLQFQLTARLVEEAGLGKRIEWVSPDCFPELRDKYAEYDGWKVFKTHTYTDEILAEFENHNAIGLYVFRDIRDVIVSLMRKNSETFEALWEQGRFVKQVLQNFRKWTSLPGMFVSKYEDMIADLPHETERIANHLGLSFARGKYEEIAADYTIERQRERIERFRRKDALLQQGYTDTQFFDKHSLLHTNHITSGAEGEWKKVLSPKQVALIERRTRKWLLANGYELTNPRFNIFERILTRVFIA